MPLVNKTDINHHQPDSLNKLHSDFQSANNIQVEKATFAPNERGELKDVNDDDACKDIRGGRQQIEEEKKSVLTPKEKDDLSAKKVSDITSGIPLEHSTAQK